MAEIVWTREATRCLEDIYNYISRDDPGAAHKVVSGIYEKIQLFRTQPRLGQRYEPLPIVKSARRSSATIGLPTSSGMKTASKFSAFSMVPWTSNRICGDALDLRTRPVRARCY